MAGVAREGYQFDVGNGGCGTSLPRYSMADLEHDESNHQSDDEHFMPSVRSDLPSRSLSVNAQNPDDLLILSSEFLELKPNNHHLDFDTFKTDHPVILEILKGHPLAYALTATANVPIIYLQQFWNTITYLPEDNNYRFEAFVDHFLTKLTKKRLRLVLQLPNKTDVQGKEDFDDFVNEHQLCADIRSLGYTKPLPTSSSFRRMYLPPIWNTLFSILNRCLTPKHTGLDKCNIQVLRLFHGVAFNKHYDYTTIFWTELEELVSDKGNSKARKFVPYQRFLQLIIRSMMRTNRHIPSRSSAPVCPEHEMKYLRKHDEGDFLIILYLPDDLLAYADQDAPSVREYRAYKASMIQPEPEGPTQEAIRRDTRVSDQREQRENVIKWGIEGDGGASISSDDEPVSSDDERAESDRFGDDNDDADPNVHMSDLQIDNLINKKTGVEGVCEGDLVEAERLSAGKQKECGENVTGFEKQDDIPQTESVSRAATSTIQSHVLGSGIETVTMDPVVHAKSTLPSHSVVSQEMSVSFSHGDLTHMLSGSHSENLDTETGRHMLESPSSIDAHVSLEPRSHLGTHTLSSIARLGDKVGTSRVEPYTGILRGPDGSPIRVDIMPALSVGHTVTNSTAVITGNLSGPGVSFPEFVSREYLNDALKALKDSFTEQFDSLKSIYKGKEVAIVDPPQPQARSSEDLSVDELKSLLYTKLLSQASELNPADSDSDLLGVLRRLAENEANVVNVDQFNSFKQEVVTRINTLTSDVRSSTEAIEKTLQKLAERVQVLEETCREQTFSYKRKHDDRDDPDRHEGRRKITLRFSHKRKHDDWMI